MTIPTIAQLTGAKAPSNDVIDGKDLSAMLLGKGKSPHEVMYYENGGVPKGQWKLVTYKWREEKRSPAVNRQELHDLDKDFAKETDISRVHPDRMKELKALLDKHCAYLQSNTREPGMTDTAKPLLTDTKNVSSLVRYLGREGEKVYGKE